MKVLFWNRYPQRRSRHILSLVSTLILVLLLGTTFEATFVWSGRFQQGAATPGNAAHSLALAAATTTASPFLFGSNLDLSASQDVALPGLLQQAHVQIVRIPVHNYSSSSKAMLKKTALMIQQLGITPLIVLHASLDSDALTVDTSIVQTMSTVFSTGTVYYEFGDEEDALGVSAARYTSDWNTIIPQLTLLAPHASFLGPASYQYNRDFLATFLQQAQPGPNAISWHEYSCASSWSKEQCLSNVSNWTQHIADARATMQRLLKKSLPIMITEWNYAANATATDGKSGDNSFLTTWTTRALQTLAASHVFAAMQYPISSSATSLIANDHLTVQGMVFQQQYDQLVTKISFEDGGTGRFGKSDTMNDIQNSTDVALDGQHSLKITVSNSTNGNAPTLWFDGPPSTANPSIGQTIVAYIYVPPQSIPPVASVYVEDSMHQQCNVCRNSNWDVLAPGMWTRVSYTVAAGISMPSTGYGIAFTTPYTGAISTTFYVDAFGWG